MALRAVSPRTHPAGYDERAQKGSMHGMVGPEMPSRMRAGQDLPVVGTQTPWPQSGAEGFTFQQYPAEQKSKELMDKWRTQRAPPRAERAPAPSNTPRTSPKAPVPREVSEPKDSLFYGSAYRPGKHPFKDDLESHEGYHGPRDWPSPNDPAIKGWEPRPYPEIEQPQFHGGYRPYTEPNLSGLPDDRNPNPVIDESGRQVSRSKTGVPLGPRAFRQDEADVMPERRHKRKNRRIDRKSGGEFDNSSNFKVEPIEMTQIGIWYSWMGDKGKMPNEFGQMPSGSGATPDFQGQNAYPSSGKHGGGGAGGGERIRGGGRRRRGGGGGGGGDSGDDGGGGGGSGGGEVSHKAHTPYHDKHPYFQSKPSGGGGGGGGHRRQDEPRLGGAGIQGKAGSPSGPAAERGRKKIDTTMPGAGSSHKADTPWHSKQPAGSYFNTKKGTPGGSQTLAEQRKPYAEELKKNPALREKLLHIGSGENKSEKGGVAVYESMLNRSAMRNRPSLEKESRLSREGSRKAGIANEHGYYAGYDAKLSPQQRAKQEKNLNTALAGSNVSNYSTGNASGSFAAGRLRKGTYPGGLVAGGPGSKGFSGEYYVGEGNRGTGPGSYQGWLNRSKGGGPTTAGGRTPIDTSIPDTQVAGGGGGGRRTKEDISGALGGRGGGGGERFSIRKGIDYNKDLARAGAEASKDLPPGYRAVLQSGTSPTHGSPHSLHRRGQAVDFQLFGPGDKKLGWYQDPGSFRTYEKFHQGVHRALPENLRAKHRFGGYFGSGQRAPGKNEMDQMHSDFGGPGRMGAGSWAHGLTPEARKRWRVPDSKGLND